MSAPILLGLYRPGTTVFHRMPVGAKLLSLTVASLAVVIVRGAQSAVVFLAVALAISLVARLDVGTTLKALRTVLIVAVVFAAFQAWQQGVPGAIEVMADLFALVILATVFTATTSINDMLDAITRWLQPYRRVGVNPEKVALAFSLMMRAVPGTLEIAQETRFAAKARGLERSARANLTPMVLRVVARAHDTGDALMARGIGDD